LRLPVPAAYGAVGRLSQHAVFDGEDPAIPRAVRLSCAAARVGDPVKGPGGAAVDDRADYGREYSALHRAASIAAADVTDSPPVYCQHAFTAYAQRSESFVGESS
jgi:hypothetical protein